MKKPSSREELQQLEKKVREVKNLPSHIAFIMDGNGRWAKKRGLPRLLGHKEGVNSVREMVEAGADLGVKVMTFYTFSTENWKRPAQEVSALMQLLVTTIRHEVEDLDKNNVQLYTIGRLEDLPKVPRRELEFAKEKLKSNDGLILNLALSYSGRQEIVKAVKKIMDSGLGKVDEDEISRRLDTAGLPDPDLLIRTSGEFRLSNFLLWQCAYTELYVTPVYWPDFRRLELLRAIHEYQHRERRFGCTSEQLVQH